jgi:PhzF family phenazine biosynthesis protein
MKITSYHVDAFADKIFSGNPAMVCIMEEEVSDSLLQQIAAENNLPVTAFLWKNNQKYQIRWFGPEYEIDLCGHGSLATGFVIFNFIEPQLKEINLHYSSDVLKIKKDNGFLSLDFPIKNIEPIAIPEFISQGLGQKPLEFYQYKQERYLAVYHSEEDIRQLNPSMDILKKMELRGIIVTAPSTRYDFVSRVFYPKKALSEDQVTGASFCLLAPYWKSKLNKNELRAYQLSKRGGLVNCYVKEDCITIQGKARLYSKGLIELLDNAS